MRQIVIYSGHYSPPQKKPEIFGHCGILHPVSHDIIHPFFARLANGKSKPSGNIIKNNVPPNFMNYRKLVTHENYRNGKWWIV